MSVSTITVRKMKKEDLDRVSQIEKECFSTPWSRDSFEDMIDNEAALYMVAEDNGYIVANCGVIIAAGEGDICNVAVDPSYRKRGIAKLLLTRVMEEASKEMAVLSFTLEVRRSNTAAISLYEKLGFVNEGIRPGFYTSPKEDAVIFWKR
ncbi:MAG: ribosomal protein S18-alanine N-acetyltransferase [Lachnospiraceae bacterium]|nr:ribosomal protein S18-alanine N-acetyltransferase [Lachnospiraceae bacterium]